LATTSFYSLKATLNNGKELDFANLKGKKVLLVNTASDCGYTPQYEGLQALQNKYCDKLVLIGFPANKKAAMRQLSSFAKLILELHFRCQ